VAAGYLWQYLGGGSDGKHNLSAAFNLLLYLYLFISVQFISISAYINIQKKSIGGVKKISKFCSSSSG